MRIVEVDNILSPVWKEIQEYKVYVHILRGKLHRQLLKTKVSDPDPVGVRQYELR